MDDMVPTLEATSGVGPDDNNPGQEMVLMFQKMTYLLERLVEGQNGYPGIQKSILAVPNSNLVSPQAFHNRMRVTHIVITNYGTSAYVTITVGTITYRFGVPSTGGTDGFPFPLVIENGTDVSFVANDDNQAHVYFLYVTE